jgi:hypothetical protein
MITFMNVSSEIFRAFSQFNTHQPPILDDAFAAAEALVARIERDERVHHLLTRFEVALQARWGSAKAFECGFSTAAPHLLHMAAMHKCHL